MRDIRLNFKNILVIDFGQLGDVVLSLPALNAIRRKFPESHIAVLTGKVPDQVVRLSGLADEVITVDRVDLRDGPKLRSIGRILRLTREIRRRPIDLVLDLHSLPETNILAFLSRAKKRLLANRESRSLDRLSNFRPKPLNEDKSKHLSERYLDVVRPLGIEDAERRFKLTASVEDMACIERKYFSDTNKQTVGLFPGAGHPSRCWNLENFAALAVTFANDDLRTAVFLGPEEAGMREQITAVFPAATAIVEGLTIAQFIAAASHLAAFVTNDTGPMHLAACAGAPIVLLLDGRAPRTYTPLTDNIAIIRGETIDRIGVEDVAAATLALIKGGNTTGSECA